MTVRVRALDPAELPRYRILVMIVGILASYLIAINTTVLGLALPSIGRDLAATSSGVDWVLTIYLLALSVSLPATGWLAARFGRRRTFLASLMGFLVGAALAGIAPGLPTLLTGRVLQGLGGGALLPLSMTMVYELYPPERRGTAIGVWGVAIAAAPALGPPAGGWVLASGSWRWIFFALTIMAAVALVLAAATLRELSVPPRPPLDGLGWLGVATSLGAVVLLSRNATSWGLFSARSLSLLAISGLGAWLLIRRSVRREHPLIDVRVFKNRTFAMSMLLVALMTTTQYAKINFLPIELQVVRGLSALDVGLLMAPSGVGVSVAMPLGGRMADRTGPRTPVLIGLVVAATTTALLGRLQPDTGLVALVTLVMVHSVGGGMMFSPLQVTAMNAVRAPLVAQASALTQLTRQVSAAIATAALSAMLVAQLGTVTPSLGGGASELASAQRAYNSLFLIAAVVLLASVVPALLLPGRVATRELQAQQREQERLDASGYLTD